MAAEVTTAPVQLFALRVSPDNPRNSEGDIIQLKDGRLALVYTRFRQGALDHSPADLAMRVSSDGGRTWSGDRILVPNGDAMNVMSVTLRRLPSGEILLFYLRKGDVNSDCNMYVRRSTDELDTLTSPTRVTLLDGYHVVNNDRVTQLSSGRLVVPSALHNSSADTTTSPPKYNSRAAMVVYYSDDQGHTWKKDEMPVTPSSERQITMQEPGIVELANGDLLMNIRTDQGSQYFSTSRDQGLHWSPPEASPLASPLSPATIKRIPGTPNLLCVWNDHTGEYPYEKGKRTPLCYAISRDNGRTWSNSTIIENDPNVMYCYTSVTFLPQSALLSYYAGSLKGGLRGSLHIAEIPLPKTLPAAGETSASAEKIGDVVIYGDPRFHCAFPSVVKRSDGSLLCAFRRAPNRRFLYGEPGYTHTDPNSQLVTVESHDSGRTWTTCTKLLFAHPLGGSQDPCMTLLKDGSFICASYGWALVPPSHLEGSTNTLQHPHFGFMGGYLLRSADGGNTWGEPIIPPPTKGDSTLNVFGQKTPAFNRGAMVETSDGRLLWATARHDDQKTPRTSVHLLECLDQGRTWTYKCPIASDPKITFNETSLVQTEGGDILAFLRTDGLGMMAAMARSRDGGKSFEKWQNGGFVGHPFQATRLADGRIFLVYGHRAEPFGVRARILDKNGDDFATAPEITLRDDGGGFDIGYPWAVQTAPDEVFVAYYLNLADGPRHIAGTIVKLK